MIPKGTRLKGRKLRCIVAHPGSLSVDREYLVLRTRRSTYTRHVSVRCDDGHIDEFPIGHFALRNAA